jgi:putative ABC transport system permease protein
MLLNYLIAAWRSLRKSPLYSAINIGGLAAGLAVCMLILLYVTHEHSYDRFHRQSDRLYRVDATITFGGQAMHMQCIGYTCAPRLLASDPRVTSALRIKQQEESTPLEAGGRPFTESKFIFADNNFFSFFTFPLVRGRAETVLQKPFSVVLSAKAAQKYFGQRDPIGQVILYNHKYPLEVTGVAADPPSNSTLDFEFVSPISSLEEMPERKAELGGPGDAAGNFVTYLRLTHPGAARGVEKSMERLSKDTTVHFRLGLFRDAHLGLNFGDASNLKYLSIFPLIAGLVLLLALINYMSLATARATTRAKEIGVRKTLGAGRKTVAFQFYVESALYACLAFALGYVLFLLFKPGFLNLLHLPIDGGFTRQPVVLALFAGLLLFTVLAAGGYPALVLSAFRPVAILRRSRGGEWVRRVFTVLQFTISIGLIACSLIMYQQLYFFRHTDTGVKRDNIIEVPFSGELGRHYSAFVHDVQGMSGITDVATSHYPLYSGTWDMNFVDGIAKDHPVSLYMINASPNFLSMIGVHWKIAPVNPRVFDDRRAVVLNASALPDLHLPADPLGHTLDMNGVRYTVAGVLKDFNFSSLDVPITGLGIVRDTVHENNRPNMGCAYIKVLPHVNLPTLLEGLGRIYARYDPGSEFSYRFLDDAFDAQYKSEDRLAGLLGVFTLLTIGIACLGLFGLATFATLQRTKEIGIRKVLGAGIPGLVRLLSMDYLTLVGLSVALALPLAWWAMHGWLQQFAYRIAVSGWPLAAAALGAMVLAFLTVGGQAFKAARANPVKSLKID